MRSLRANDWSSSTGSLRLYRICGAVIGLTGFVVVETELAVELGSQPNKLSSLTSRFRSQTVKSVL
jgi:hypothetical protein